MITDKHGLLRKLASLAYSLGVVSLIIGILLSVSNQPVFASTNNGVTVDPRSVGCPEHPTNTPGITNTQNPTDVNTTGTPWPTEVNATGTPQPTEVNGTGTQQPTEANSTGTQQSTEVTPVETQKPTEVDPTGTKDPTVENATATQLPTEVKATETLPPTVMIPTETMVPTTVEQTITLEPTLIPTTGGPINTLIPTGELTLTSTPTVDPLATASTTPLVTPIADQTSTVIPTSTEISFNRLGLVYECVQELDLWTITNSNPFPVDVDWSFSSGPGPGSATIPANSSINFYAGGGNLTITITWNNGETSQSLSLTSGPCQINVTSTPSLPSGDDNTSATLVTAGALRLSDPGSTPRPSFVSTLAATIDPSLEFLIPVTGADFSNPFSNMPLSSIFLNLGFVFLGMAFLTHGLSSKLK